MARRKDVFFAFPSDPPLVGEIITKALRVLAESLVIREANVRFRPWTDVSTPGKQLAQTIAGNIERAEVFACDLTYPNFNVAFELGYSIGKFKRIWPAIDVGIEKAARDYKRIYYGLLGLAYAPYQNHVDLANAFLTNPAWVDLDQTALGHVYRTQPPLQERPSLLYLKPALDTEAAIATGETLRSSMFGESLLVDDPKENPSPTLEWYAEKIRAVDAVAIQLLSTEQNGHLNHNVKCSIIAGLTWAFGKPLLMLAQTPFESPVDYQQLLKTHDTTLESDVFLKSWIDALASTLPKRRPRRPEPSFSRGHSLDLRGLFIGEPRAEHESRDLDRYFLETSAYYRAMTGPTTIVVGRRGTGKTAILYALQANLIRSKDNHVCILKPDGYEIEGLVRVLRENMDRSERG